MADDKNPHGNPKLIVTRSGQPHAAEVPVIEVLDPIFVRRNPDGSYRVLERVPERLYRAAIEYIDDPEHFGDMPKDPARNDQFHKLNPPVKILPAPKADPKSGK